jgi:hypothetical protein
MLPNVPRRRSHLCDRDADSLKLTEAATGRSESLNRVPAPRCSRLTARCRRASSPGDYLITRRGDDRHDHQWRNAGVRRGRRPQAGGPPGWFSPVGRRPRRRSPELTGLGTPTSSSPRYRPATPAMIVDGAIKFWSRNGWSMSPRHLGRRCSRHPEHFDQSWRQRQGPVLPDPGGSVDDSRAWGSIVTWFDVEHGGHCSRRTHVEGCVAS